MDRFIVTRKGTFFIG